jgi:hypothetical protein
MYEQQYALLVLYMFLSYKGVTCKTVIPLHVLVHT